MINSVDKGIFTGYAEIKTIDHSALEGAIREGWVILSTFSTGEVECNFNSVPNGVDQYGNNNTVNQNVYTPKNVVYLIIGRTSKNQEMEQRLKEAEQLNREFSKEHKELKGRFSRKVETIEVQEGQIERLGESVTDYRAKARKMEEDLGKIERALGTQEMKKILHEQA